MWWSDAAWSAEPLVFFGDEAEEVAWVAEVTGRTASEFEPVAAESLLRGPITLVRTPDAVQTCAADAVTSAQLELALSGAEGAFAYGEDARAVEEVERIRRIEACPPDPFDADAVARYWFARARLGRAEGWRYGRSLAPREPFPANWPEALRDSFDGADPGDPVRLTVLQPDLRVDGRPVDGGVDLAPGWHALHGPRLSASFVVDQADTLVVPSEIGPIDPADPDQRPLATAVLAARFGEGTRVFVAEDAALWVATAGRADWTDLSRYAPRALVPVGFATAGLGALATVATTALSTSRYQAMKDARQALVDARSTGEWTEVGFDPIRDRYAQVRWFPAVSGGVTAVGLALGGVGLALGPVPVAR